MKRICTLLVVCCLALVGCLDVLKIYSDAYMYTQKK